MSQLTLWFILSAVTGSPVAASVGLLLFWLLIDRVTIGFLPDPLRLLARWRRGWQLERTLLQNSHDGRARLELAQIYTARGRGKDAVDLLRPLLEKGADDIQSVFAMGEACLNAGYVEQGEKLLAHAEELDPEFRVGEVQLVLGRYRLARGDFKGAKEALTALVKIRVGSIEGRFLLAKAHQGLKDDAAAAMLRDEAWHEYVTAPRFQRRKERYWAWRARPSRPATYALLVLLSVALFVTVIAPHLSALNRRQGYGDTYTDPGLDEPTE
jgi:tetratricopeptide (TPR) repeat protein